jgi:hypothetical protein
MSTVHYFNLALGRTGEQSMPESTGHYHKYRPSSRTTKQAERKTLLGAMLCN